MPCTMILISDFFKQSAQGHQATGCYQRNIHSSAVDSPIFKNISRKLSIAVRYAEIAHLKPPALLP